MHMPVLAAAALSLTLAAAPAAAQIGTPDAPGGQQPAFEPPTQPPQPFPAGARVAFVNLQRIASESAEGRAATARVQALNQEKVTELDEKNNELQAAQQKLLQSGALLSDQARLQLEREIERMQVSIQRFTEDAQAEIQDLQIQLQQEFEQKVYPVIEQVCEEMELHMLFSQTDSGLVWAGGGLDITNDLIRRFDQAMQAGGGQQPE